jgi:hypothetical protein
MIAEFCVAHGPTPDRLAAVVPSPCRGGDASVRGRRNPYYKAGDAFPSQPAPHTTRLMLLCVPSHSGGVPVRLQAQNA